MRTEYMTVDEQKTKAVEEMKKIIQKVEEAIQSVKNDNISPALVTMFCLGHDAKSAYQYINQIGKVYAYNYNHKWYRVIIEESRRTGSGSHHYQDENWVVLQHPNGYTFEVNAGWGHGEWVAADQVEGD